MFGFLNDKRAWLPAVPWSHSPDWSDVFQSEPYNCKTDSPTRGTATTEVNSKFSPSTAQGEHKPLSERQLPCIYLHGAKCREDAQT